MPLETKKKDTDLGQTAQNSIKFLSLRCFPVQVRHFHTSGLLNKSAVWFCFDDPAQRLRRDLTFVSWVGGLGRRIYRRKAPRRREEQLYYHIREAGWRIQIDDELVD